MKRSDLVDPAVKGHVDDITTLFHFTRKLMLTLEISEVMRIILEEANSKIGAEWCSIEIDMLGYTEIYSMPAEGQADGAFIGKTFANYWNEAFTRINQKNFEQGRVPHEIYKGRHGKFSELPEYKCLNFPLSVTGEAIGSLSVWVTPQTEIAPRLDQYMHILTSITSPVIGHVYADLQARHQAKTDGLTGIANHRHFYETLEREVARANRKKNSFALILADIDNFKAINDTHGHQIGDAVIVELTKHLKANVRAGDLVARYGGEEFCVILSDTNLDGSLTLADRIREAIAQTPFTGAKQNITYTSSFGLAMYDGNKPIEKDELIAKADKALYESKKAGKNRVTVG
ncbi:MAG: GGDEF domain-containing protein, partial [Chitinispirillales bacterium]|jgi:diguanylate cyclase (GGDEF)-like protein|nr:GGDEF domain-containing protein [Chitinispirillales bacterium]